MVSSIARSRSLYDIFLAHSGETQGFILAPGDDGKPLYRPGLAPDLSPQQRIDVFSYEHRNPTIDLPASFESFLYGAGFEDAPDSSELGSKGYHYSQGIDVSNGRRGYLSPEKQTGGTTTEAPLKIVSTSLGLFAMTSRYVYENVAGTWTQRLDTGGAVTNTDLIEFTNSNGSYLLLGVTGQSYYISTNGTAWTQPSTNGSAPSFRATSSPSNAAATSVTVTAPVGTTANDILIATIVIDANETISPPTGWTEIAQVSGVTNTTRHAAYWKRAGASEPANYTFTWTSSVTQRAVISAYQDVITSGTPFDEVSYASNTAATNHVTGAVTILGGARTAVVTYAASDDNGTTTTISWTPPSGFTERVDSAGGPSTHVADDVTTTSGTLAAQTAVSSAAADSLGVLWILKPAITGAYDVARWAARGQSSGSPVLWAVDSEGDIRSATDPTLNTSWSAADATQMGEASISIAGLEVIDNVFILVHEGGITSYDGTTVETVWQSNSLRLETNNARPAIGPDKKVYFAYGGVLARYTPSDGVVEKVWPKGPQVGSPEINGTITAIAFDVGAGYFALKNAAGNTYVMKFDPAVTVEVDGQTFTPAHTWYYNGASDIRAMAVCGASSDNFSSTNPTLVIGDGTTADYLILPKLGQRPEDDSACRFITTADRVLYGPYINYRAQSFPKWLRRGDVEATGLSATKTVALQYQAPGGSATTVATATADGRTTAAITSEVEVTRVRPVTLMNSTVNTASPVLKGTVLHAVPNPPRDRTFQFAVSINDSEPVEGGEPKQWAASDQDAFIWDAKGEIVTLTDPFGSTHTLKILDIEPLSFGFDGDGKPQEILMVLGAEI